MKHIIFGGFDYAVPYEMNQDSILYGVDYFVDNDPNLIGTKYLGKEINHPSFLLKENKEEILILIGSIIYRTEIASQLKEMGFVEDKDFIWAISFNGDTECRPLWHRVEWNDREKNATNLAITENGEYTLARLKEASKLVDFDKYSMVIDLGAATERLRQFLPSNVIYIPVDYTKYSEETRVCDLNKNEFPNDDIDPNVTCIFAIGILQFCENWKSFLTKCSEKSDCIILEYMDFPRINREYRKTNWTRYNALFDHEIIMYMLNLGFELKDAFDFRLKSTCYRFEKRR